MAPIFIPLCLFNFKAGGWQAAGKYDFKKLLLAFQHVHQAPAIIVLNEAYEWAYRGDDGLLEATAVLAQRFKRPYQGRIGWHKYGDFGPALLFDPTVLQLQYWGNIHNTVAQDMRNVAKFNSGNHEFEVVVEHWDHRSGRGRMTDADRIAHFGKRKVPVLVLGDFNEPASGPHLPQLDFTHASAQYRQQKGKKLPNGSYITHTDAVDLLVGEWCMQHRWNQKGIFGRRDGRGFYMVAELAAMGGLAAQKAFTPTVNLGVDTCGESIIDMLLVNDAWLAKGKVLPETYQVHIPQGNPNTWPSDHRLISVTLCLW